MLSELNEQLVLAQLNYLSYPDYLAVIIFSLQITSVLARVVPSQTQITKLEICDAD
jgi:hypothetical protein